MTQYGYSYARVLIVASRVLDSQFPAVSIELSGAQLEMLRNMTQYLNERTTFVDTYWENYYEIPGNDDWDAILAIVADLEAKLMGNGNTTFGYEDRLFLTVTHVKSGSGAYTLNVGIVPAGYVYVLNVMMSVNADKTVTQRHLLTAGAVQAEVAIFIDQESPKWATNDRQHYILKEDDSFRVKFEACDDGDTLIGRVWGYRMAVPG